MSSSYPIHSDDAALPSADVRARYDEQQLVTRVQAGDVHAFEQIFLAYYPALCGFVDSYVRSEAIAEELVADLFRRIWEQREHWAPNKSVASYLFAAARNRAIDHLKHQRIERRAAVVIALEGRVPAMGAKPEHADAATVAADLDAAIERAIAALPERCRTAFTLRRRQHLSYAEIAVIMGTTVKTVEIQIGLALKALRRSLADWRE